MFDCAPFLADDANFRAAFAQEVRVLGGLIELVDGAVGVRVQTSAERLVELFFNRLVGPLSYRCREIVLASVCRTKD
jgi:hypothetical protein